METEGNKDNSPNPQTVYEVAEKEVGEISALIPLTGSPIEVRSALNTQIREKFPTVSDIALVWLTHSGHDLSRRELIARLRGKSITQFQSLIEIMMPVYFQRVDVMSDKLFKPAYELSLELVSSVSRAAIVDSATRFLQEGAFRDREFFENILSKRNDLDEIADETRARLKALGIASDRMSTLKDEAMIIKTQTQT